MQQLRLTLLLAAIFLFVFAITAATKAQHSKGIAYNAAGLLLLVIERLLGLA